MSQLTVPQATPLRVVWWTIHDSLVMTRRNLIHYIREPRLIFFSAIQPVIFLLLFTFVFGGAIESGAPGNIDYINYLIPGILVQTVIFASTQTTVGLADDLSKGMVDRFRSLPMSRAAVLAGRTLADSIRGIFTTLILLTVGTLIGFRTENGIGAILAVIGLAFLIGYAFTWISANIGLLVKSPEVAQVAGFIWIFPATFASSVFVPVSTMPDWLQGFAKNQPISVATNAVRGLLWEKPSFTNLDAMALRAFVGLSDKDVQTALLWVAGILIVFIPLSVYNYSRNQ
ncbi:MAG: ABC transporter permease [Phototrophicaceae bacterium]